MNEKVLIKIIVLYRSFAKRRNRQVFGNGAKHINKSKI